MITLITQNCLICRQSSIDSICQYCQSDLTLFDCHTYQHNLMHWPKVHQGLAKVTFPNVLALSDYQWPISKLLTGLKFSSKIPNAYALASLFTQTCLTTLPNKPQLIIPIPLHKNRFLLRKFNQSIEIAKHIGQLTNIPMNSALLSRCKSTQQQTELTAPARRKNLRNAFSINNKAIQKLAEYKHIVLFDDVITTGTTVDIAFELIHELNPNLRIDVWSICITLQR